MFTGIIEEVGKVISSTGANGTTRLVVSCKELIKEIRKGDSIAVSGVCLTAVELKSDRLGFDLATETLARTSLGRLKPGSEVNLELPMKAGGRMGGHIVQGHVDGVGRFLGLDPISGKEDYWLRIEIPADLAKYVVFKGSMSIEGISLTVAQIEAAQVTVAIIPHTVTATNLHSLRPGDPINIEVDIIAKYAEKMLKGEAPREIDVEKLVSEGF
jgi:riboflavin synthase